MIDSHTHAWAAASPEHPWTNGPILDLVNDFDVHTVYTAERLLRDMDRNGVDEAVVVGYPICDWTDNWYTRHVAETYDRLHGIVMLDPFADDAVEQLDRCLNTDGVLGFRLGAACPYDRMWETFDPSVTWLRDAIGETKFWEAAHETEAVVQILAHVDQLDQVVELVDTYPELTYLIDHFSHADPNVPPAESSFAQYADLAEYSNVYAKISEVQHRSEEDFPYTDMHNHVRWLLERFGKERIVWGSDYPNVSDVGTYVECLNWLNHVDGLSNGDRKWMLGRSFERAVDL